MANYSTAFGSLPTPQQVLGGTPGQQQNQASQAARMRDAAQPRAGSVQTFAQMQQNGVARPAPPAPVAPPPGSVTGGPYTPPPTLTLPGFSYTTPVQGSPPRMIDLGKVDVMPEDGGGWEIDDIEIGDIGGPPPIAVPSGSPSYDDILDMLTGGRGLGGISGAVDTYTAGSKEALADLRKRLEAPSGGGAAYSGPVVDRSGIAAKYASMQPQGMPMSGLPTDVPELGAASELQQRLSEQLDELARNPSAFGLPEIQQMREAQRAELEAEFGAQRKALEEQLARRGISASSIAAGMYGDISGQQARALASMEAQLTEKAAESAQRGREQLIQGLSQAAGIKIESRQLDLESKKVQADIQAEAERLMRTDRSLDLQQARDIAQERIAMAQLAEQAADRVSRENLTMAQMQQNSLQFAARLGLDGYALESQIRARAAEIGIANRELDERTRYNMAQEQIARDTLNQRVAESDWQQQYQERQRQDQLAQWEWLQNYLLAEQEAAAAAAGQGGTLPPPPGIPQYFPPGSNIFGGPSGGYFPSDSGNYYI